MIAKTPVKRSAALLLALIAVGALVACGSKQPADQDVPAKSSATEQAKVSFARPGDPRSAVITQTSNPAVAVDGFIQAVYGDPKFVSGSKLLASASQELDSRGQQAIVVSILCSENTAAGPGGPEASAPLFTVIERQGQKWRLQRLPDEAIGAADAGGAATAIPGADLGILDDPQLLTAGQQAAEELVKNLPARCQPPTEEIPE